MLWEHKMSVQFRLPRLKWPGDGIRNTYDTQNVGFVGSSPTRATTCLLRLALGGRHPDALS